MQIGLVHIHYEPGQYALISVGLIMYLCSHISGPHEPIPTKFGLWRFFIMLYRYTIFKKLKCKKVFCDVITSVLYTPCANQLKYHIVDRFAGCNAWVHKLSPSSCMSISNLVRVCVKMCNFKSLLHMCCFRNICKHQIFQAISGTWYVHYAANGEICPTKT